MQIYRNRTVSNVDVKSTQNSTQSISILNPNSNSYLIQPSQQRVNFILPQKVNFTQMTVQKPMQYQYQTGNKFTNKQQFQPIQQYNVQQNQINFRPNQQIKAKSPSLFGPSNLDIDMIVESMNKSSLKQLSGGGNVKHEDLMVLLTKTVDQANRFSMLHEAKIEDLKHYFRIVQINQSQLFESGIPFSITKTCQNVNSDRKKYQLLITLDGKQIKFQSMTDRKVHYNINLDTLYCQFLQYSQLSQDEFIVKFVCGSKIIQIFINQSALPFHLVNDKSKTAIQYIERSAKQIAKFLNKAIDKSRGKQYKLIELIKKDKQFFMNNYASQQQFTQYCQTGDILLFKDNHTFAKIQRAITNSEYDHMAFVYRSDKYGVCLIQSSSCFGVSLTVWTHLIRKHWFRGIQSISWRRLLMHNKPKDYQKKVQEFINANKNKKYGISFIKLLTFSRNKQAQTKQRTYFCSQLVAQLYKVLGLLDPKVSSTQYWPKHFSQKGYISMLDNSALDKQRKIIFQQQILKQNYRGYTTESNY